MLDINKYKKMAGKRIDTSYTEQKLIDISRKIDNAYNNTINAFNILSSSDRGTSVTINFTQEHRAVIDYNKDLSKPDLLLNVKEIWINKGVLHTGDYVSLVNSKGINETYIVITYVNSEKDYDIAYMQLCNNVLKWKDESGIVVEQPIIIGNLTLYSDGLDTSRFITTEDGKRIITISNNEVTKKLYEAQRFVINSEKIFSISHKDNFTLPGVIVLTMIQGSELPQDDLKNNIAYNGEAQTEQIPIASGYVIGGNSAIHLNEIQTYTITQNGSLVTNRTFTWNETTIDGLATNLITVLSSTGTELTVQANNSYKYGKVKLTAICNEDINLKLEKVVQIASML